MKILFRVDVIEPLENREAITVHLTPTFTAPDPSFHVPAGGKLELSAEGAGAPEPGTLVVLELNQFTALAEAAPAIRPVNEQADPLGR